jgi:hypothetical protein
VLDKTISFAIIKQKQNFTSLKENETNWWFGVLQNLKLIKKNENMTILMKILQGLMLKHIYILLILNFPLSMQAAIFPLSVT